MTRGVVIDGAVFDAQREAERIRAEAAADARRVREEAQRDADALRARAVAEGQAAGRAEAAAALVQARRSVAALEEQARAGVVRVAIRVAERIVGRALEADPALCAEVCAAALGELRRARAAVLRLHPDDVPLVQARLPELRARAEGAELVLVADPGVGRGGCVVSCDAATVDARIETQLAALERALLESA